jgi:hypothetical protein
MSSQTSSAAAEDSQPVMETSIGSPGHQGMDKNNNTSCPAVTLNAECNHSSSGHVILKHVPASEKFCSSAPHIRSKGGEGQAEVPEEEEGRGTGLMVASGAIKHRHHLSAEDEEADDGLIINDIYPTFENNLDNPMLLRFETANLPGNLPWEFDFKG